MNKLSMCRICLVEDVRMHSIADTKLQEIYEELTSITFQTGGNRPLQVCYLCYARLRSCYRLQATCLHSEKLFTQMLTNNGLQQPQSQDLNTFKIAHPIKILSYIPVSREPDLEESNMDPLEMRDKLRLKVEATEDDIADLNIRYMEPEVIVKTIDACAEYDDELNDSTHSEKTEHNIQQENVMPDCLKSQALSSGVKKRRSALKQISKPEGKDVRLKRDVVHVPKYVRGGNNRKRCVVHQRVREKFVNMKCVTCDVYLCFESCWEQWHSVSELPGREIRGRKRRRAE